MGNFPKLPEGTVLPVGAHLVTILKYLSEGGFAHIYKVKIDPIEEDTDIACLKRVIVPDKNGLNQLRKEVEVMKKLRHGRNIVKYYDSHAERLENGTYQVLVLMELCPNKSLLDFMNSKIKTKLTEPEILKIMIDISIGIYEMHKMKLVHRDIKIENVLIDAKHDFKLCDFGSTSAPIMPAKDQQQLQVLSHDIMYQTTPQYRAPEMIDLYRGFPIDEKADIWALGCFLYKLCYYTTPFEASGDIAILHASFQFMQVPEFSGDLKNLIIIMLQENPFFRPNIVQVLMLLSTIMKIEFKTLKIEDIYKVGPYNFHALHEYQRHKQNEILKQQQLYYQRNAFSTGGKATSEINLAKQYDDQMRLQTQSPFVRSQGGTPSNAQAHSHVPTNTDLQSRTQTELPPALSHDLEPQKNQQEAAASMDKKVNIDEDDNASEIELENLDNVEERYPSLDDLIEDSTKKSKSVESDNISQREVVSPVAQEQDMRLVNPINYYSQPNQQPHQQPIILNNAELLRLTPEQFQQYHYQHQAYQYQLDQFQKQYYQQLQQQQLPEQQQQLPEQKQLHVPQFQQPNQEVKTITDNIDNSQVPVRQNMPSEFEKKEAWERHHSKMEKDAEKLADDIFATNSPILPAVKAQKSNQSAQVDIDSSSKLQKNSSSEYPLTNSNINDSEEYRSLKKNIDSTGNEDVSGLNNEDAKDISNKSRNSMDDQTLRQERDLGLDSSGISKLTDEAEVFANKFPDVLPNIQFEKSLNEDPAMISAIDSNSSGANFPFPPKHNTPQNKVDYSNPRPDMNVHNNETRKNANPWGSYTKSNAMPIKRVSSHSGIANSESFSNSNELLPTLPIHEQMNALSLKERTKSKQKLNPNLNGIPPETNLIDLEVGLESSVSSSSTPVLKPKSKDSKKVNADPPSLDLDEDKKSSDTKPQYKKRLSSMQNHSNFSFQEEVIDFASDDENPENSSEMNRLSIRNSLSKKPKSRKSSEHKRSDSSNSEGKKRLSLFGGQSSN